MNQTSILIANRHISKGEEITRSYGVDYRKTSLKQREYHLLKNYIFQCECRACIEKWPLSDLIPDELMCDTQKFGSYNTSTIDNFLQIL